MRWVSRKLGLLPALRESPEARSLGERERAVDEGEDPASPLRLIYFTAICERGVRIPALG